MQKATEQVAGYRLANTTSCGVINSIGHTYVSTSTFDRQSQRRSSDLGMEAIYRLTVEGIKVACLQSVEGFRRASSDRRGPVDSRRAFRSSSFAELRVRPNLLVLRPPESFLDGDWLIFRNSEALLLHGNVEVLVK